jgi:poly(3-hydroxyalkanoate) synthetase
MDKGKSSYRLHALRKSGSGGTNRRPVLADAEDDITTPGQVLDAEKYIGTPKNRIMRRTVPGDHIGLFVGARTQRNYWPSIAAWIRAQ